MIEHMPKSYLQNFMLTFGASPTPNHTLFLSLSLLRTHSDLPTHSHTRSHLFTRTHQHNFSPSAHTFPVQSRSIDIRHHCKSDGVLSQQFPSSFASWEEEERNLIGDGPIFRSSAGPISWCCLF